MESVISFDMAPGTTLADVLNRAWVRKYATWRDWLKGGLKTLADFAMGNTAESALQALLFQNVAFANVGNTAGLQPSSAAGSLFVSLHTATLATTATQSTSEAAYTGYARVGVVRSSGGWTIAGNQPSVSSNTAAVTFPPSTSGPETEVAFGVGTASTGAGELMWPGTLTSSLVVNSGVTPSFPIGQLTVGLT